MIKNKKHDTTHNPALFQVSLKILLVNKKNEYLILKDVIKTKYWKGKFDLPGGRINPNELKMNFHKILDREIREEIGNFVRYKLRSDPVSLAKSDYPYEPRKIFILFEGKYLGGEIIISDEHFFYRWERIDKVNAKKLFSSVLYELMSNYFDWNKK